MKAKHSFPLLLLLVVSAFTASGQKISPTTQIKKPGEIPTPVNNTLNAADSILITKADGSLVYKKATYLNSVLMDEVIEASGVPVAAPTSKQGGVYRNTATGLLYVWNGTAWVLLKGLVDGDYGDLNVTSGGGIWILKPNVVTNLEANDMPANTVKGNNTGSSADPTDIFIGQNQLFGRGSTGNLAPMTLGTNLSFAGTTLNSAGITSVTTTARLSGNGTSGSPLEIAQQSATSGQVLKWNGTSWAPGTDNAGGVVDGDYGEITVTSSGGIWALKPNVVTNLEANDMAANTVKGNNTGSSADPTDIFIGQNQLFGRGSSGNLAPVTLGTNLSFAGTTLNSSGITTVSTTARLSGNGTSGSPLEIAQQSATSGQVMKWNGTAWAPGTDNIGVIDGDYGDVNVTSGGGIWILKPNVVTNVEANDMPANTVKGNSTGSSADPTDIFIGQSQLFGRGATGNLTPVTLGTNLSFSGTTLNASGGSAGGDVEAESDNTLIIYQVASGTPTVTASRTGGVQTISVSGGTIKLKSVATKGASADLAGDNSFKIICNGVVGTAQLAYPVISKWNLSGSSPSDAVPHIQDTDNTPQIQVTAGTAGTSLTARVINLNAFTDWVVKMVW